MNTMLHNRALEIDDITNPAIHAAALAELTSDVLDAEVSKMVADAESDVSANLLDDLRLARTQAEHDTIETLLSTRYDWLDAHFRDHIQGRTAPSPASAEADRLWALVAAERGAAAYAELVPLSEAEFWADVPF